MKNLGAKIQSKINLADMEWLHFDPKGQKLTKHSW